MDGKNDQSIWAKNIPMKEQCKLLSVCSVSSCIIKLKSLWRLLVHS